MSARRQVCSFDDMLKRWFLSITQSTRNSINNFLNQWRFPTPLQIVSAITFSAALISGTMMIIAMVVNELVMIGTKENIYYVPPLSVGDTLPTPAIDNSVLLIPQIDISIGLSRACVGSKCLARDDWAHAPTLLLSLEAAKTVLPSKRLQLAYEYANAQFLMGYQMYCGIERTPNHSVRTLCIIALVMASLTLLTITGLVVVGIILHAILTRSDVFYGLEYEDPKTRIVVVGIKQEDAPFFLAETHLHIKYELRLLRTLIVLAFANELFSLTTMSLVLYLVQNRMKCGVSMCSEFYSAMNSLQDALSDAGVTSSRIGNVSCAPGVTFGLFITVGCLGTVVLVCTLIFYWMYNRSKRYPRLLQRKLSLERFWSASKDNSAENNLLNDDIPAFIRSNPDGREMEMDGDTLSNYREVDNAPFAHELEYLPQHNLSLPPKQNELGHCEQNITSNDTSTVFRSADYYDIMNLVAYRPRAIEEVTYEPPKQETDEPSHARPPTHSLSAEKEVANTTLPSPSTCGTQKSIATMPRTSLGENRPSILLPVQSLSLDSAPGSRQVLSVNAPDASQPHNMANSDAVNCSEFINPKSTSMVYSRTQNKPGSVPIAMPMKVLWPQSDPPIIVKTKMGNPLIKEE